MSNDPYKAGQDSARNNQNVPKQDNYRDQKLAEAGHWRQKEGKQ